MPDISNVKLSPDGTKVLSIKRLDTAEQKGSALSVYDIESGKSIYPIFTDNKKYTIGWAIWGNNEKILISANFPEVRYGTPTTESRLLILDTKTGKSRSAIPKKYIKRFRYIPQFQNQILDMLPDDDAHFLLQLDGVSPGEDTVYKVSLERNKMSVAQPSENKIRSWKTDRQHNVRIAVQHKDTEYKIKHRFPGKKKWTVLWEFESFAADQVWPMGFGEDPNHLYVSALHEGRDAVFLVDLRDENLAKELIYANENYDVDGSLVYSHVAKKVVGISTSDGSGYIFWDKKAKGLHDGINKALPDTDNYFISMSADERRYIALATNDTDSGVYLLGDRDKKTLKAIAYRYAALPPELMSEKKHIEYKARDGLEIEGYLTLPKDYKKGEPAPSIVFPHGGPISYDGSGFDYWTQFFANRGYAVLQMNFRGSSGYGYDFMKAGLQNWGLAMQDDVEDGARWMIDNGYANPDKICIVGASYGGYAALMGSVKTPDLYKCSVSFAGVTDIAYLVKSAQRYTSGKIAKKQIGSNYRELKRRSPINHADKISIPTLLIHGTEDRSVKVKHSRRMHKALLKAKKEVEYLELKDGSHHLSNEVNRIAAFEAMETFLAKYLKD